MTPSRVDSEYGVDDVVQYKNALYVSLLDDNTGNEPDEEDSEWWSEYTNPITMVYNALWSMLEAHKPLASMVKIGNRVKLTGANRLPIKEHLGTADLPELRLVSTSSEPHVQRTSTSSSLVKRFKIEVCTGDRRLDAALFPLEWAVYCAMHSWQSVLASLKWNDAAFVKLARPVSVQDSTALVDMMRGVEGWTSLWECEVHMWFGADTFAQEDD